MRGAVSIALAYNQVKIENVVFPFYLFCLLPNNMETVICHMVFVTTEQLGCLLRTFVEYFSLFVIEFCAVYKVRAHSTEGKCNHDYQHHNCCAFQHSCKISHLIFTSETRI